MGDESGWQGAGRGGGGAGGWGGEETTTKMTL